MHRTNEEPVMPARIVLSLCLALASASPALAAPSAPAGGLAYDEVDYYATVRAARPAPDFAAHFVAAEKTSPIQASAVAASPQPQSASRKRGLAGAISAVAAASALGSL